MSYKKIVIIIFVIIVFIGVVLFVNREVGMEEQIVRDIKDRYSKDISVSIFNNTVIEDGHIIGYIYHEDNISGIGIAYFEEKSNESLELKNCYIDYKLTERATGVYHRSLFTGSHLRYFVVISENPELEQIELSYSGEKHKLKINEGVPTIAIIELPLTVQEYSYSYYDKYGEEMN
jgi:hypothetical protein